MTTTSPSPELTRRAEQALLGALLSDRGRPQADGLAAGDFDDLVHQAIYAALTGAPGTRGPLNWVRGWLTRLLGRDAASYLEALPERCPDSRHLTSYAAMVGQASADRAAAARDRQAAQASAQGQPAVSPAERLDAAADYLAGPAVGKNRAPARPMPAAAAPAALSPEAARLARALRPLVRSMTSTIPEPEPVTLAAPAGGTAPGWTQHDPTALQDRMLATLLQRPGEAMAVIGLLPAVVFTEGPRRQLFEMIGARVTEGRPVDPLIIAWAASQAGAEPQVGGGESLAQAAIRLAVHDVTPGTATLLARALHAEYALSIQGAGDRPRSSEPAGPAVTTPVGAVASPGQGLAREHVTARDVGQDAAWVTAAGGQPSGAGRVPGEEPAFVAGQATASGNAPSQPLRAQAVPVTAPAPPAGQSRSPEPGREAEPALAGATAPQVTAARHAPAPASDANLAPGPGGPAAARATAARPAGRARQPDADAPREPERPARRAPARAATASTARGTRTAAGPHPAAAQAHPAVQVQKPPEQPDPGPVPQM